MKRKEIRNKVIYAIQSVLGENYQDEINNICDDTKLFQTGLEFSSLDGVLLIVKIEEIFNIKWPDELLAFDDILTVGEVVDTISKCIEQGDSKK